MKRQLRWAGACAMVLVAGALSGAGPARAPQPSYTGQLMQTWVDVPTPSGGGQVIRYTFDAISKTNGLVQVSDASTANVSGFFGKRVRAYGRFQASQVRSTFGSGPKLEMVITRIELAP